MYAGILPQSLSDAAKRNHSHDFIQNYLGLIFCHVLSINHISPKSILFWQDTFLPRDASAERGDATVSRLSVCLSIRP